MRMNYDPDENYLCYQCVSDTYLSTEIKKLGSTSKCSYCNGRRRAYTLENMADRVEQAFNQHYERTGYKPDEEQYRRQFADPESAYYWEREGESLPFLLEDVGGIPYQAAHDIQNILDTRHYDYDTDFLEHEYSKDALYELKIMSDHLWQDQWEEFERIIKRESRFFSKKVYDYLSKVFHGLDKFTSQQGHLLVRETNGIENLKGLYRARVFQEEDEMLTALKYPDQQIGTPPSKCARAGRMNASGIAVFYGATSAELAVAEVRPPVGSKIIVGYFEIKRTLRLLDLTALRNIRAKGSIFDPEYVPSREKALFLRRLAGRVALPVMPNQENQNYLPTQIIADFLAEAMEPAYDGIIFPSTQSSYEGANVVLFHRAARVEEIQLSEGSEISATSRIYEPSDDMEYESYNLIIQEPGKQEKKKSAENSLNYSYYGYLPKSPIELAEDTREVSLKIHENDLQILSLNTVEFTTTTISYQRLTIDMEKRGQILDGLTDN